MVICRLTLLLGPPGAGKRTLLLALARKLDQELKVCYVETPNYMDSTNYIII